MTDVAEPRHHRDVTAMTAQPHRRSNLAVWLVASLAAVLAVVALGLALTNRGSTAPRSSASATAASQPVPQLLGLRESVAVASIKAAGLKVGAIRRVFTSVAPPGGVFRMAPAPGTAVPLGTAVDLTISLGPTH